MRPFGATLDDLLTQTHETGGLNFGTIGLSFILASIPGLLIIFATLSKDQNEAKAQDSNVDN